VAGIPKNAWIALVRWGLLVLIPVIWIWLDNAGRLESLENRTIDWRFRSRGEIPAPVKVIYVDIDSLSIGALGNFPWKRIYYQQVAQTLIEKAGVRAVGFDLVVSPSGVPNLIDDLPGTDEDQIEAAIIADSRALATFLFPGPPVVFGASFSATDFQTRENTQSARSFPVVATETRDLSEIEAPELTSFQVNKTTDWSPPSIGLIDTVNGETRAVYLWAPTNSRTYFHMAVELARLYWGLPPGSVHPTGDDLDFIDADGNVVAHVPMVDGQRVEINWFSAWDSPYNPRVTFAYVQEYALMLDSEDPEERALAEQFFAQEDFKDAIVLVGPVDRLLQDLAPTPFDSAPVPKVGVHGNLLKTIISGLFIERLEDRTGSKLAGWSITLGLTLLVTLLSVSHGWRGKWVRLVGPVFKVVAVAALAVYALFTFQVFESARLILPFVAPLGAAFSTSFVALAWEIVAEERRGSRIKGLFGTYLSPTLVEKMVDSGEDPRLGGHEETITAYFSDIESFSTFSEKMSPALLVELMNEYLTACTDIVQEEGGTLDKYIGDAIVAMYGAPVPLPDHAYRACVSTIRVQRRIAELREKWRDEGDKWPEVVHGLRARLGLNTGSAIIGNMGSRSRFSYTMMGDNVNLAARMESGAKSLGVYTMVTDATRLECEKHGPDKIIFRFLDRLVVKGRSQPVPVYQIVGFKEEVKDQTLECLDIFAKGMERYLLQDWDGATVLFEQSLALEPRRPGQYPKKEVNPSQVFVDRCAEMRRDPPGPGWDGVYVMKVK